MKVILQKIIKIENYILFILLLIMGITLFVQVCTRYIFNKPLMWTEEFARYLHINITFLGIGYGIRNKAHIRMVFFIEKMPPIIRNIVNIITNIFLLFFVILVIPSSFTLINDQYRLVSIGLGIRMHYIYLCIPIGFTIAGLYLLTDIYNLFFDLLTDSKSVRRLK